MGIRTRSVQQCLTRNAVASDNPDPSRHVLLPFWLRWKIIAERPFLTSMTGWMLLVEKTGTGTEAARMVEYHMCRLEPCAGE